MEPQLTIDGRDFTFIPGETILEVAGRNDIHIPTLCYLAEAGHRDVCRMCVVDVEGAGRLLPACSTPATAGMVVDTGGERVLASRRETLKLVIGAGRHTCITCEALGDCDLSRLAYEHGVEPPAEMPRDEFPLLEDAHVIRDYSKCILCGRCWAACAAIQARGVMPHPSGRRAERAGGKDWYPLPDLDECEQCGQCVDACPVGVLSERRAKGAGRYWELERVRTTCPHCGMGCQTVVCRGDGEVVRVNAAGDSLPNRGTLCRRGRFAAYVPEERERLQTPLLRDGGALRPATWDEALAAAAEGVSAAVAAHGPSAVAALISPSCTNEDAYQAQKLLRAVIGSDNVDHRPAAGTRTPDGVGNAAAARRPGGGLAVLEEARAVLVVGDGDIDDHAVAGAALRRAVRDGARLMVVDAGHNPLADVAEVAVSVERPAILAVLEAVMDAVRASGAATETAGVPAGTIAAIAASLTGVGPAVVCATLSAEDEAGAVDAAVLRLRALLDEVAGVRGLTLSCCEGNSEGLLAMGVVPGWLPGTVRLGDAAERRRYAEAWGADGLPTEPGLGTAGILAGLATGGVSALWVSADDAEVFGADAVTALAAPGRTGLLIAQSSVLGDVAATADIVLPSVAWGEGDGTFTNVGRRVSRVRVVRRAPDGARPAWWVFREVARRLGATWAPPYPRAIWDDEIVRLIPDLDGVTYAALEHAGVCWPATTPLAAV